MQDFFELLWKFTSNLALTMIITVCSVFVVSGIPALIIVAILKMTGAY